MSALRQHVLCKCGHGALIHTGRCWKRGCDCQAFEPDPQQIYEQNPDDRPEENCDDLGH